MKRLLLIALAALATTAASAQTLNVGMAGDPATLDPAQSVSYVDRVALRSATSSSMSTTS